MCTLGLIGISASKGVLFIAKITGMTLVHRSSDAPRLGGIVLLNCTRLLLN